MALTAQTTLDIVNSNQQISFYSSSVLVDQIIYSNNQLTFATIAQYNLSKSDFLLFYQYLNVYFLALQTNFAVVNSSLQNIWPLCQFDITENNIGTTKLIYTQASSGTNVLVVNYVPIAMAASISARASPVVISVQEFFMTMNMLTQ